MGWLTTRSLLSALETGGSSSGAVAVRLSSRHAHDGPPNKGATSIHEGWTLRAASPSEAPSPETILTGLGFQGRDLGEHGQLLAGTETLPCAAGCTLRIPQVTGGLAQDTSPRAQLAHLMARTGGRGHRPSPWTLPSTRWPSPKSANVHVLKTFCSLVLSYRRLRFGFCPDKACLPRLPPRSPPQPPLSPHPQFCTWQESQQRCHSNRAFTFPARRAPWRYLSPGPSLG